MQCPNYLTLKQHGDFLLRYPYYENESQQQWIERHNPRLEGETAIQWTFRMCEHPEWRDYIIQWPCVECPMALSQKQSKDAGKPVVNIELIQGQTLFVGNMGFRSRTEKVAVQIEAMMKDRIQRARDLKNIGNNPGGEEADFRYGFLYHDKAVFHLILQHLQVASQLSINIGVKSWPYTNQVLPTQAGQTWGSQRPLEREGDPDAWLKLLDDDGKMERPYRQRNGQKYGYVASNVNGWYRPIWQLNVGAAPIVLVKGVDHVLLRCHKLEHEPKSNLVVDDPYAYRPRVCHLTQKTWKLWEYYSAYIPMCASSGAVYLPGWMNPEKVKTYHVEDWRQPAANNEKATPHYFVPVEAFEPIESLLACFQGWDKNQLVQDGRIFVT